MAPQGFYGSGFLLAGGTSGIGLSTAKKIHSLGGDVVISGLELNEEIKQLLETSPRYHFIAGDLSDAREPSRIVAGAMEHLPQLNGLLFAAGMTSHLPWDEISTEEWDKVFAVNTRSLLLLAQSSITYLRECGGSIVAISSTNGENVNKNNLVYDVSKAALNHVIRALALELRDEKIRVNGIAPGGVDTPLLHQWLNDFAGDPQSAAKVLEESRAKGLLAQPEDIADIATFLFSEGARWINGAIISADFGASLG